MTFNKAKFIEEKKKEFESTFVGIGTHPDYITNSQSVALFKWFGQSLNEATTKAVESLRLEEKTFNLRYKKESMESRIGWNRAIWKLDKKIDELTK